jgi:hypothetical protein
MAHVSIEADLKTYLLTQATVTAWIGTGANARIYWTTAPDAMPENETYPYIVYFTVAANGELQYLGTRSSETLVQFSIFDTHPYNGLTLANAVFDALNAYHGKPGSKKIYYISANGPRVLRDPDYDNIYHYIVDATVDYER